MQKTLILGAKGMLGYDLAEVFRVENPILWDKDDLDITDKESVSQKLGELKPDIVINAAAYTAVDDCEINKDLAVSVNGLAVGYLAQTCQEIGAVLVHYSTDYVFDGNNVNGYKEDDSTFGMPINMYGKSKLLGEQFIKEIAGGLCAGCEHNCEMQEEQEGYAMSTGGHRISDKEPTLKYYIIRTSWLYGKNGPNFVDKILALAKERDIIKVVNDQFGKPTYARDLAKKTKELLDGNYPFGIYHVTNETKSNKGISWFDFATKIVAIGKKNKMVKDNTTVIPCSSEEFPRPAKRPRYSMLINTKLSKVETWDKSLERYLNEI